MARPYQPPSGAREAGADPVAGARRAARSEEVAASDGRDVVGHRLRFEAQLDPLELAPGILVEGDEQKPLVLVSGLVEAAVVVVGPAQDPLVGRLRRARVREADVGVERDSLALGVRWIVRVLVLGRAAERRP